MKLPAATILPQHAAGDDKPEWSIRAVNEFARLAPQDPDHAQRRDLTALRKQDVQRVAKAAVEIAKERETNVDVVCDLRKRRLPHSVCCTSFSVKFASFVR